GAGHRLRRPRPAPEPGPGAQPPARHLPRHRHPGLGLLVRRRPARRGRRNRPRNLRPMPSWEDAVAIGLRYPAVGEKPWFGTPGLKGGGKGFCRMRTNPDALVIRVLDVGDREALLRGEPDVFFTTPHYDGYPYVLVRLDAVDPEQLEELVEDAWRIRAPKTLVE